MRDDGPRPLREGLDRLLRGLGAPPVRATADLFGRSAGLLGPDLSPRTTPGRLRNGTLTVLAEDPAVADAVRWEEPAIIARAAEVLGPDVLRRLVVRVRPGGA